MVVPTAITLSPSHASRATEGSGRRRGAATGSSVSGSSTETVEGSRPAGASPSFVTSSPPSSTTNELCGRATGNRCEARTSSSGLRRCAQRPKTSAGLAGVRRDPAGPVRPAGQPRRRGGHGERLGIEPLYPPLDRGRLRAANGYVVTQRIQLARLAAHQGVGREGVVDRSDLEPLARPDAEPGLARRATPAARATVLARPGPGPIRAGHCRGLRPGRGRSSATRPSSGGRRRRASCRARGGGGGGSSRGRGGFRGAGRGGPRGRRAGEGSAVRAGEGSAVRAGEGSARAGEGSAARRSALGSRSARKVAASAPPVATALARIPRIAP